MTNEVKGYSLFNDVQDSTLRTWNRCATMFNINSDHGQELAAEYASQLDEVSMAQMQMMYKYIQVKGYENVRAEINQRQQKLEA